MIEPGNKQLPTDEQAQRFAEHMDAAFHFFVVGDYRDAAHALVNHVLPALDEIGKFDSRAAARDVAAKMAAMAAANPDALLEAELGE